MIKYRIKEITYKNGTKEFKVESKEKINLKDIDFNYDVVPIIIVLTILTLGTFLFLSIILLLYYSIFSQWIYFKKFDDLYEAQLYVEQKQERDKEAMEQKQKAEELKKAQKIVSERVIK